MQHRKEVKVPRWLWLTAGILLIFAVVLYFRSPVKAETRVAGAPAASASERNPQADFAEAVRLHLEVEALKPGMQRLFALIWDSHIVVEDFRILLAIFRESPMLRIFPKDMEERLEGDLADDAAEALAYELLLPESRRTLLEGRLMLREREQKLEAIFKRYPGLREFLRPHWSFRASLQPPTLKRGGGFSFQY